MQASEYLNWGTAFGALKSHLHIFDYIQWSKKWMKIIQNCNKDGKKKKRSTLKAEGKIFTPNIGTSTRIKLCQGIIIIPNMTLYID